MDCILVISYIEIYIPTSCFLMFQGDDSIQFKFKSELQRLERSKV